MIELDRIYNMDCLDKWADVNGFEGKYKVSRNGDIFSILKNPTLTLNLNQQRYTLFA